MQLVWNWGEVATTGFKEKVIELLKEATLVHSQLDRTWEDTHTPTLSSTLTLTVFICGYQHLMCISLYFITVLFSAVCTGIGYTMRMRGYQIYTTEGEARGRVYSMTPNPNCITGLYQNAEAFPLPIGSSGAVQ